MLVEEEGQDMFSKDILIHFLLFFLKINIHFSVIYVARQENGLPIANLGGYLEV